MKALLLILLPIVLFGQVPKPPDSFLIGVEAGANSTPKPLGFGCFNVPLDATDVSWSMYQSYIANRKVVSSAATGLGKRMAYISVGRIGMGLWIIGAIGVAQPSVTATTGSFNEGAGVSFDHIFKRWPSVIAWVGAIHNTAGGTNATPVVVSFGRTF